MLLHSRLYIHTEHGHVYSNRQAEGESFHSLCWCTSPARTVQEIRGQSQHPDATFAMLFHPKFSYVFPWPLQALLGPHDKNRVLCDTWGQRPPHLDVQNGPGLKFPATLGCCPSAGDHCLQTPQINVTRHGQGCPQRCCLDNRTSRSKLAAQRYIETRSWLSRR